MSSECIWDRKRSSPSRPQSEEAHNHNQLVSITVRGMGKNWVIFRDISWTPGV